jgi:erythromycin esterase
MKRVFRLCIAFAATFWATACTTHARPEARPEAREHFAGRVLHADGRPASGAVVIISDATTGDILSTVRATGDGRFASHSRSGTYGLTATDAQAFAYVPSVDGQRNDVLIRLDPKCHRFSGRIRTGSPIPKDSVVRLSRASDQKGDVFGAAVAPEGQFQACIPAGTFGFKPPEGFVRRPGYLEIPRSGSFEYRTESEVEAQRIPKDMNGAVPSSSEDFVASFPASIKILGLGESNHGSHEFYAARTELAKSLATKHGVRLLMLEAGYGEMLAIDDYVNGASLDPERAVRALGYWIYDTKTFLRVIAEIRAFNAPLAADKRIRLIGVDVQTTEGAIRYLQRQPTLLAADEAAALDALAVDRGKAWSTLTSSQRAATRAALGRIADARGTGSVSSKSNRTALAARSLLLRLDMWETANEVELSDTRDAGMARMALAVLAIESTNRATLWAHLVHVAREYNVGERTLGAHLAAALGEGYRAYGLLAFAGSARAWDMKQEIGVIASTLQVPPPHSLEAVLKTRSSSAPLTYWTFAAATGEAARWLKGVRVLRTFGSMFMGEYEVEYWDLQSFDGAILFESVSPTDPTPTGERRAQSRP